MNVPVAAAAPRVVLILDDRPCAPSAGDIYGIIFLYPAGERFPAKGSRRKVPGVSAEPAVFRVGGNEIAESRPNSFPDVHFE